MPIKDWVDGERPPASDLNRYPLQQVHIVKIANEAVASSTTMQDDDHLFVSVDAGADYWVQAYLLYEGDLAGDLKIGWSGPTGATFDWMSDSLSSSVTDTNCRGSVSRSLQAITNTPSPGALGPTWRAVALPRGVLRVGVNAGIFRFRWAQLASSATSTTIYANSLLRLRRLTT